MADNKNSQSTEITDSGIKKTEKAKADTKGAKASEKKPKPDKKAEKKPAAKPEKKVEKKPEKKVAGKAEQKAAPGGDKKVKENPFKRLGGLLFAKMAKGGAQTLRSNAEEVNQLNVFPVPDGDTGDNMSMTIESGVAAIEGLDTDDLAEVMKAFSHGMLLGARGNSGVILSQFFAGVAAGFENCEDADPKTLGAALEKGVEQAYSSVMTPTEGTILTVAREAVEYSVAKITPKTTLKSFFSTFVKEMHASVERTPDLLPTLKEAGVVDSGGAGLFYIMDGFNRVFTGEPIAEDEPQRKEHKSAGAPKTFGPDDVMQYGYCTEMLVALQRAKCDIDAFDVEVLRKFLGGLGDSVVCFKTEHIVKIHVHTMTPERVIAHMRMYGELITVKIENMSIQHTSLENGKDEKKEDTSPSDEKPKESGTFAKKAADVPKATKKYGVVAVSNGEGIDALFREFGADETIYGGQTHNPSAQDFIDAFERIPAEHIFVLPNNSNILLAAGQAAGIYEHAKIHVVPTKSIGTGYVAISMMDFSENDPEVIMNTVTEAINNVICGYISPAIRDTNMNGVEVKNGDTIGIIGKEIVVDDPERLEAAVALADKMLSEGRFMLTVFCGKDLTSEECNTFTARIEEKYPDAEIYTIDAGQEIYPYIFVAE